MLDPKEIKVGDRLKWHLIEETDGCFSITDGHGATVIREPYFWRYDWFVDVGWDPGTTQLDGGYLLKGFVYHNTEISADETTLDYDPCRCEKPDLVRNFVGGKEFLFCRVCKKERPILTF